MTSEIYFSSTCVVIQLKDDVGLCYGEETCFRIVAQSIGNISGACDGCSPGILEMYQEYIDGRKELREINMEFQARYLSGAQGPRRGGCGFAQGPGREE